MDYPKLRAFLIQDIGHERYLEIQQTKPANPNDPIPPVHFYEFFGGLSGSNRVGATQRQVDAYRILAFLGAYMTDREDSDSKKMVRQLVKQYASDYLSENEAVGFLRATGVKAKPSRQTEKVMKTESTLKPLPASEVNLSSPTTSISIDPASADTHPLARSGGSWTEPEVRKAYKRQKELQNTGVLDYSEQTAKEMNISKTEKDKQFKRFKVKSLDRLDAIPGTVHRMKR